MGAKKDVKFADRYVDLDGGPLLIVGQNPGRQRIGEQTFLAWEGNKSSDLLQWVLDGVRNVYFTNVCQYQEMTEERIAEGLKDLKDIIKKLEPRLIVCLGIFAHAHVCSLDLEIPVTEFVHPSYVVRFNKDREVYKRAILKEIL